MTKDVAELAPCEWTVFRIHPGEAEEVAGRVMAVTYEEAWTRAHEVFGDRVNAVTPILECRGCSV